MDIIARSLPPSKAHRRRDYVFLTHRDGRQVLTVRQGWADTQTYEIEETHESGAAGRVFVLCKRADGHLYETFLAADGSNDRCTCDGWRNHRGASCKHRDALRDLLRHGDLPHPYDNPMLVAVMLETAPEPTADPFA